MQDQNKWLLQRQLLFQDARSNIIDTKFRQMYLREQAEARRSSSEALAIEYETQ